MIIKDILDIIEGAFPPSYQEDFDNTGLQLGPVDVECTGALLCVDVTPAIIGEAVARGCNLIITHHPLMFHGVKQIANRDRVERCIRDAILAGVAVYSCHTAVDNTPLRGVSWKMGEMLGLSDPVALEVKGRDSIGSGLVGCLPEPLTCRELAYRVKAAFGSPVARCSEPFADDRKISVVGLCGGAGSFLIGKAMEMGAQAFVTSDCKYNLFLDHADDLFLVDIGHFESEECTKSIFYQTIKEKIPNFALYNSETEKNPIIYL